MAIGFVRPARTDDASGIARIQLSTWRTAYRRLLPRHILDELDEDWMAGQWARAIAEPPSDRHRVLVAVEQAGQQHLVGFLAAGPADEEALSPEEAAASDPGLPAFAPDVVAVTDLLVEPRWGRRGHGSRLLAAGVEHWYSDGFDTALAWAYQDDVATVKFLTSAGWAADGAARALDVDDRLIPQLRLHVSIGEPKPGQTSAGETPAGGSSAEQLAESDGEPGPVDH